MHPDPEPGPEHRGDRRGFLDRPDVRHLVKQGIARAMDARERGGPDASAAEDRGARRGGSRTE